MVIMLRGVCPEVSTFLSNGDYQMGSGDVPVQVRIEKGVAAAGKGREIART